MYTIKAKDPAGNIISINTPSVDYITKYEKFSSGSLVQFADFDALHQFIESFDPQTTILAHNQQYTRLTNSGFQNVIDLDAYQTGDKWVFENGSYAEKVNANGIQFKYKDGSNITRKGSIIGRNNIDMNQISFFMNIFPEDIAEEITNKAQELFNEGGQSTWGSYNYSEWWFFAQWSPSSYPPIYNLTTNTLGGKNVLMPALNTIQVSSSEKQKLDDYNKWFDGIQIENDPYSENPDGDASTGGGDGEFNRDDDSIDHPGLPTTSAVDTGFITIYNPSLAQLQNLASYMWSGPFDLDSFKKIFADPMDAILGLSMIPVLVPNGGTQNVKVGNIDTGIPMTKAASQFVTIDCGSLQVETGVDNTYFDYSPFSKAFLYLPFIGTHAIDIDDIVKHHVSIKYNVDILSGGCVATVKCGGNVRYDFQGSCSTEIPITGQSFAQMYNGIINIGAQIGQMVGSGGMSGALGAADIAATAVNSLKPEVERSGAIGAVGGLLGREKPALIVHNPRLARSSHQNKYLGYPSFITSKIGSLSGYTEIDSVRLNGMSATDEEKREIESLLKGGVIV